MYYSCPNCHKVTDLDGLDILGADEDKLFCTDCHHEFVPSNQDYTTRWASCSVRRVGAAGIFYTIFLDVALPRGASTEQHKDCVRAEYRGIYEFNRIVPLQNYVPHDLTSGMSES